MDEDDSCRICRSGPEPDAPLYHPCKCTGSIRYCHQDCLVEWLQHSRKKYCELCNHAFIFHKKYRKDMPSEGRLPRYLYFRRLVFRSYHLAQLAARALLVGFTWLALLPYINIIKDKCIVRSEAGGADDNWTVRVTNDPRYNPPTKYRRQAEGDMSFQ